MGKLTISMAIFNSFLLVYQAGYPTWPCLLILQCIAKKPPNHQGRLPIPSRDDPRCCCYHPGTKESQHTWRCGSTATSRPSIDIYIYMYIYVCVTSFRNGRCVQIWIGMYIYIYWIHLKMMSPCCFYGIRTPVQVNPRNWWMVGKHQEGTPNNRGCITKET